MPATTRTNVDGTTGHEAYLPRPNTPNGSPDVFINGEGVVRVTDAWPEHTDPGPPDTHDGTQSSGSTKVFANGLAVARIGDAISCGDVVASGSPDVISG